MLMLSHYATAIRHAAHVLGTAALLANMRLVLLAHEFLPATRTPAREHVDDLAEQFTALAIALPTPTRQTYVSRLAQLHVDIFGADIADLAMQAVMVSLTQKIGTRAAMAAPPQAWLVDSAVRVHAQCEPDEYTAADVIEVRVRRGHVHTQPRFVQWMERTFANAPARATEVVPARRPRSDDDGDQGSRRAHKRARATEVWDSDADMELDSDQDHYVKDHDEREADMDLDGHVAWMDDAMDQDPIAPPLRCRETLDILEVASMDLAIDHNADVAMPDFVPDEPATEAADAMLIDAA